MAQVRRSRYSARMTQQIAGVYRALRGLFGLRKRKGASEPAAAREVRRFPEDLWKLDESYRNLMRELSRR